MAPAWRGPRQSRVIHEHVPKRRRRRTSASAIAATASDPSKFVNIVKHRVRVGWLLLSAETSIVHAGMVNVDGGGLINMLRISGGGIKRGFGFY